MFKETEILLEILLTYTITSNEGERSFSHLKRLLSATRTTMTESRMCNLARMALHPARLNALDNDTIIDLFADGRPRKLLFKIKKIITSEDNDEGSICLLFFFIFLLFNCSWARILCITPAERYCNFPFLKTLSSFEFS